MSMFLFDRDTARTTWPSKSFGVGASAGKGGRRTLHSVLNVTGSYMVRAHHTCMASDNHVLH